MFPVLSLDRVAKLYQPKRVVRKRAAKQKRIDQLKPNYHQSIAKDILQRFVFRVRALTPRGGRKRELF